MRDEHAAQPPTPVAASPQQFRTRQFEAGLRARKSCFTAFPSLWLSGVRVKPHLLTVAGAAEALPKNFRRISFPFNPLASTRMSGYQQDTLNSLSSVKTR
ncbi:MAG: hypothetical protein RL695_138 [Pseudomonadota bacterium]|jgi:hypothetical protein